MKALKFEMNDLIEKAEGGDLDTMSFVLFSKVEVQLGFKMKEIDVLTKVLISATEQSQNISEIKTLIHLLEFLNAVKKEAQDKFEFRVEIEQLARKKQRKKNEKEKS